MSIPIFIHVMQNGDVWSSIDPHFLPTGTVEASYRVNSLAHTQKLGTIGGTSGAYTASGTTGVSGKEKL